MIFYFAAVAESHTAAKYFCLFDKSHGINRSAVILKKGHFATSSNHRHNSVYSLLYH